MLLQLNPPLPVITPLGNALAHLLIDYGPEMDLHWVCFQDATGECWTFGNPEIRAATNRTLNRPSGETIVPEAVEDARAEATGDGKVAVEFAVRLIREALENSAGLTVRELSAATNLSLYQTKAVLVSHTDEFEQFLKGTSGKRGMRPYHYRLKEPNGTEPCQSKSIPDGEQPQF